MVHPHDDFCSVSVNDEGLVTLRGCENRSVRKRYQETRVEMTEERVEVRYSEYWSIRGFEDEDSDRDWGFGNAGESGSGDWQAAAKCKRRDRLQIYKLGYCACG